MYHNKRIRFVEVEEMNKHLLFCKNNRKIVYQISPYESFCFNALLELTVIRIKLTYKYGDVVTTYICRLDGEHEKEHIAGKEAYRIMQLYYKVPKKKANFSASPFMYFNPKFEGKRVYAYSYDLNSAYAHVLKNGLYFPDTSVKPHCGSVKENEIGFDFNGELVYNGFAPIIFPTIESPFKKFVDKYFDLKHNSNNLIEREKAKSVLNFGVGYYQYINPFLRSYVVNGCNNYIQSLIDENTIYANTDNIVSLVPRTDLKIGDNLGEWKFKEGNFAYIGFNYQWNLELPTYRRVPKKWFKEGWDILKDEPPKNGNVYCFDKEKLEIKEAKYEYN